ncbi:MAG: redox-sensing transcriptional repressor Rex [Treponemataceae bacterium]
MLKNKVFASPTVRRLPSYLQIIKRMQLEGFDFISGTVIANELHLEPIQVRKDLALTGVAGKPKRGYQTAELINGIEDFLGWNENKNSVLIGAGNLGTALTGHKEFKEHGLHFVAAFDDDKTKINQKIHGINIHAIDDLANFVTLKKVSLAVLTVPANVAQDMASIIVASGIKAIWNFTNVKLKLPVDVLVQQEDLLSGYALLCVMQNNSLQENIKYA